MKFPGDGQWYLGLVNEAADAESRRGAKYLGKDGRPDARVYAFYGALVGAAVAAGCLSVWRRVVFVGVF